MFTYTCAESVTAQARALTTETSAKKRSLVKIKAKAEEEEKKDKKYHPPLHAAARKAIAGGLSFYCIVLYISWYTITKIYTILYSRFADTLHTPV